MSLPSSSSPNSTSPTSISIPQSLNFIGSSDDAVLIEMIVLMSTTDRLRDTLRNQLSSASFLIDGIEANSEKMNRLGKLIKSSWVPVTYASLKSSANDADALRDLFAADGPNLGDTLAESEAELASLAADGITLTAPKQTPVMVEQFTASNGKVNYAGMPSASSFSWDSDDELKAINPGSTPGEMPGSVVKTVEVRDSNNKLLSVTRYTVFVDYANLRPTSDNLSAAFVGLQQKLLPLVAELEQRLSKVVADMNLLDERIRVDKDKVSGDLGDIAQQAQAQSDEIRDGLRIVTMFRIELEKTLLRAQRLELNEKRIPDRLNEAPSDRE